MVGGKIESIDDVEVIRNIRPSGEYNEVTGFPLIDDDTLPEWLLSKAKKHKFDYDQNGEIIAEWEKGEVMRDPDGKPYLSLKAVTSLLMGLSDNSTAEFLTSKTKEKIS